MNVWGQLKIACENDSDYNPFVFLLVFYCFYLVWCFIFFFFFLQMIAECADIWYKLSKDEKESHIRVMRIYLLSPFLFGQVYQDDKVRHICYTHFKPGLNITTSEWNLIC